MRFGARVIHHARGLLGLVLIFSLAGPAGAGASGASRDTLGVREILRRENAELDSLLDPESLAIDSTGVDSLLRRIDREGIGFLDSLDTAFGPDRGARLGLRPLELTTYNRVEGLRLGAGASFEFPAILRGGVALAYGFARHGWVGRAEAALGSARRGPSLRVEGGDMVLPFGPNRLLYGQGVVAFVAGQDRQDYLRRRGGRVEILPWRSGSGGVHAAALFHEELSVARETDYSLIDGRPIEEPNPMIDHGRTRAVLLGFEWRFKGDLLALRGESGVAGGELGGDFDYSWQAGGFSLRPVLPDGGVLALSASGMNTGGGPPLQSRAFLGGEASLRGYHRLEFVGRRNLSARVEYEIGLDLLGRTGLPVLSALRLQFIPFGDAGSTWGEARGTPRTRGNLKGSVRSSLGIGIQRDIWLPGVRAVRLDIIRRTDGAEDPWGAWFRLIPLSD